MRNYIRAALAGLVLSAIPIGARAASCITAPAGGTQCYEPFIQMDPTTGLPVGPGGAPTTPASPGYVSESAANFATGQTTTTANATTLICAARAGRRAATIQQLGTTAVYVGPSTVTATGATGGVQLTPTVGASLTIPTSAAIYGLSTAADTVACLESY